MGWMDDEIRAWRESAEYARSQELMRELGPRTDLDRVVIACHNDIVLAEQHEAAGDRGGTTFVEIIGTRGVAVSEVFEQYASVCHCIYPDNAVTIPWSELVGRSGPVYVSSYYKAMGFEVPDDKDP